MLSVRLLALSTRQNRLCNKIVLTANSREGGPLAIIAVLAEYASYPTYTAQDEVGLRFHSWTAYANLQLNCYGGAAEKGVTVVLLLTEATTALLYCTAAKN